MTCYNNSLNFHYISLPKRILVSPLSFSETFQTFVGVDRNSYDLLFCALRQSRYQFRVKVLLTYSLDHSGCKKSRLINDSIIT
jgi:hypothetical protein